MPGPGAYWFGKEEIDAALEVLNGGYLFRYGDEKDPKFLKKVYTLEKEFAAYSGSKYALATSSGTSSILASAVALGLKAGDEVIVPAYTFVATYSALIFLGIVPVLAEIDESLCIDPDDIEKRITPKTKAIIPVHMLGNSCDMDRIMAVANKHGIPGLEDCCQAAGASYKGRKVGTIGKMGAFLQRQKSRNNWQDGSIFPQYF